jgi:tetratricopeptide (TPR) repeat protein
VKYLEQAMQLDPDYEFGRRLLISAYLDLNDPKEADAVAASAPHPVAARLIPARVYSRDWSAAVELGDESDRLGTAEPIDLMRRIFAMRIHARSTGDYARTRDLFTQWSRVTWDANGRPIVPQTWLSDAPVGLADMLMQMGERERARALLEAVLQSFDDEIRVRGRGEFWYLRQLSLLYALLERDDDALTTLEKCITQNSGTWLPLFMANDPAFQRLRSHPRFRAVAEQAQRIAIAQRRELDQMRAKGLVPYRTRG